MLDHWIERLIFASRWLMVPFYLGLVVTRALMDDLTARAKSVSAVRPE